MKRPGFELLQWPGLTKTGQDQGFVCSYQDELFQPDHSKLMNKAMLAEFEKGQRMDV